MVNDRKFTEADVIPALIAFVGGMICVIFIVIPFGDYITGGNAIFAGIVGEPAKAIGVIIIALKFSEWLSSKTKGAVFGAFAGLGFAFMENLWYFIWFSLAGFPAEAYIFRTLLSAPGHLLHSAFVGMGLVYVAAKGREGGITALKLLVVAIFFHGLYNASVDL